MLATLTLGAALFAQNAAIHQAEPPAPAERHAAIETDARLAPFAAFVGSWTTAGDPPMQETWMPAHGNNMTGVLRWFASDGTVRMWELVTITAETDAVRMRIRHFDKHMTPWQSETEGPMVLELRETSDDSLTFAATERAGSVETITYRVKQGVGMVVTLDFNGMPGSNTIKFIRSD